MYNHHHSHYKKAVVVVVAAALVVPLGVTLVVATVATVAIDSTTMDPLITKYLKDEEERRTKRMKQLTEIVATASAQAAAINNNNVAAAVLMQIENDNESEDDEVTVDHRQLPRAKRKVYSHENVKIRIYSHYLGPMPLFDGKQFDVMFRISKQRFQCIMEDIGNGDFPFYKEIVDGRGQIGVSFEARLLLPLKSMAYGVPSHCFRDYFEMSETIARTCCVEFNKTIKALYASEYLRHPSPDDVRSLSKLHKSVHGFDGMFGSLDCMHTRWKNCPKGWQGSYQGKSKRPTIVLEAICDYHMWFWHAAYGYAGCLNDTTILSFSPFLDHLVDGTFEKVEEDVTPFTIGNESFDKMYILVDGIYPKYSRFVHGIKEPATDKQKKYTKWQEGCRKDIERAFAVLQGKWQCLARPMLQINLPLVGEQMASCLILHNMCVSDRVMGDARAKYDPANSVLEERLVIEYPNDLLERQAQFGIYDASPIGTIECDPITTAMLTRRERWELLSNKEEFTRLHSALADAINIKRNNKRK